MGKTIRFNPKEADFQQLEKHNKKNGNKGLTDKNNKKAKRKLHGNFDKQRIWPLPSEKKKGQRI